MFNDIYYCLLIRLDLIGGKDIDLILMWLSIHLKVLLRCHCQSIHQLAF